jgi:hypothetical protein
METDYVSLVSPYVRGRVGLPLSATIGARGARGDDSLTTSGDPLA